MLYIIWPGKFPCCCVVLSSCSGRTQACRCSSSMLPVRSISIRMASRECTVRTLIWFAIIHEDTNIARVACNVCSIAVLKAREARQTVCDNIATNACCPLCSSVDRSAALRNPHHFLRRDFFIFRIFRLLAQVMALIPPCPQSASFRAREPHCPRCRGFGCIHQDRQKS